MNEKEIMDFCKIWLAAWTGNHPEKLIDFYSEDAFYLDPAKPEGLNGRKRILTYFKKLLAANPTWQWEAVEVFPTERGFVGKWKATIPTKSKVIVEHGMDIVEIENGKVKRNEVYFNLANLMAAISKQ